MDQITTPSAERLISAKLNIETEGVRHVEQLSAGKRRPCCVYLRALP